MGAKSDAIGKRMAAELERIVKSIALDVDRRLRRSPEAGGTPVGTGHVRANWVPSVGAPFAGVVAGNSSGPHDAGVTAVEGYKLEQGPAFVTNNVPYILELNDGRSDQEPAGFVERAIDESVQEARSKFGGAIDVTIGRQR